MTRNTSKTAQAKGSKSKTVVIVKTDPISLIKIRAYVTKYV